MLYVLISNWALCMKHTPRLGLIGLGWAMCQPKFVLHKALNMTLLEGLWTYHYIGVILTLAVDSGGIS